MTYFDYLSYQETGWGSMWKFSLSLTQVLISYCTIKSLSSVFIILLFLFHDNTFEQSGFDNMMAKAREKKFDGMSVDLCGFMSDVFFEPLAISQWHKMIKKIIFLRSKIVFHVHSKISFRIHLNTSLEVISR